MLGWLFKGTGADDDVSQCDIHVSKVVLRDGKPHICAYARHCMVTTALSSPLCEVAVERFQVPVRMSAALKVTFAHELLYVCLATNVFRAPHFR